jgi:CDP-diacylglycerol--glycerol-3-phosphate 3-phosphatidyltransferase
VATQQPATIHPLAAFRTLPNQLTLVRLGLSLVLFGLIAAHAWASCLIVFALASLTDWLDGWLARRWAQTSDLGRVLDPLVDKVLICGIFTFLLPLGHADGWMTPWMVTLVVARELLITGLRGYLESIGVPFGADWLGKLKMTLQCVAAVVLFVALLPPPAGVRDLVWWLRLGVVYVMLLATALSGLQYVWRAALALGRNPAGKASL